MTDMLEILTPRELPQLKYTTDRGTFQLLAPDGFQRRVQDSFAEALRRGLVVQPPGLVVNKPDTYSLAAWQTALRNQGDRGTCFTFAVVAAMEARYRRQYGRVLDLSEQYLFHRCKYSELYSDYATSQVAWEDNSSLWGGQGSGAVVFWLQRFGLPEEADCPYTSQGQLEALRVATPAAGLLDGKPGMVQENIDALELLEGVVPRTARMRARHRVVKAFALPQGAAPGVIENALLADCEVIVDVLWNPVWNASKNAFDYGGNGGGHCVLIVGYERTARVFLVKNSHNDGQLLRMSYDYFTGQSPSYHYITEVSHPDAPVDAHAPWIGAHTSELGGAGTLVIRRTTNFRAADPTAPTKLGALYQNGQGRDVNGTLIDGGRGAIFHIAETTARVQPGAAAGTRIVAGEQGSWRWCCKCQSLHYAGNTQPTACAAGGAHDSSGSGWYALPYTLSPLGGQPGWAWCRKCQTLFYGRHAGGRCPSDGGRHDGSASYNYIVGWEGAPRNFTGQAGWRWCNKCDALHFGGGGATRCPVGGAHDAQGSGAYYLRHTHPLPWQRFAGALRSLSVGADGAVFGVTSAGAIFRRRGAGWDSLPGALVQVSVGDAANVWGVNAAQQIFRWNGAAWDLMPGALTCVAAAADGTVWGVNSAQQIFRWDASRWTLVPGGLVQIAVASASLVFGVASNGQVFRRVGDGWERLSGGLRQVSVAADGSAWGVNSNDEIFPWNGGDWDKINGGLHQVAHRSRERVWGVSADDQIWYVDP